MSEPNIDELREQASAEFDPQFAEDPEIDRDELFDSALYDILDDIYEAREILKKAKGKIQTRKFNELDRRLGEAEDMADELLEKGL
jgi:hypothetical protein